MGMLFDLPSIDGVSLGAAAVISCLTGVAATLGPAWRASRLDPVRALRVE